ncbi:MAG: FAD-dependent oxidoreductase [Candidatus Omnitrophica bacterium]|nr:FAD-dependent oxidoreductase [Candidatus Omnitrophota bacterium]
MKKITIIGAGFAGLSALSRLRSYNKRGELEITLINDKQKSSFLPMLPDCLGRGVSPKYLALDLASLSNKKNFNFIKDKVTAVDLVKKEISTSALTLDYDFLVIASGSETNFYGNDAIKQRAFKLDDAEDAARIRQALDEKDYDAYLIVGGGYTGIEVATNLRVYLNRKKINKRVVIVERAPSILGPLPEWMKDYVLGNLKRLNIEVLTNSGIEKVGGFSHPMLVWTAGVRSADYIQELKVEKNTQGRIKVDEYLRVDASCFAAGDAAYFAYKNNFLRMAVQFAIMQGRCAAGNIIRTIHGKGLVKYRPVDLGLIIPMANNKACGIVLGVKLRGYLPILLHYIMCAYRSYGFKNRLGILKNLITGR